MSLSAKKKLAHIAEMLSSWSVLEVFLVSVMGALFELSSLSRSFVEEDCKPIDFLFATLLEFNFVQIPSCYAVFPDYRIGAFVLLGGTMVAGLSALLMEEACQVAIEA